MLYKKKKCVSLTFKWFLMKNCPKLFERKNRKIVLKPIKRELFLALKDTYEKMRIYLTFAPKLNTKFKQMIKLLFNNLIGLSKKNVKFSTQRIFDCVMSFCFFIDKIRGYYLLMHNVYLINIAKFDPTSIRFVESEKLVYQDRNDSMIQHHVKVDGLQKYWETTDNKDTPEVKQTLVVICAEGLVKLILPHYKLLKKKLEAMALFMCRNSANETPESRAHFLEQFVPFQFNVMSAESGIITALCENLEKIIKRSRFRPPKALIATTLH